jgi:hypothetical protein
MYDIEDLYQQYRREIRPFMEMLKHRKIELGDTKWRELVSQTEQSIINSPDQYLSDLPQKSVLDSLIHRLFAEFLQESA